MQQNNMLSRIKLLIKKIYQSLVINYVSALLSI